MERGDRYRSGHGHSLGDRVVPCQLAPLRALPHAAAVPERDTRARSVERASDRGAATRVHPARAGLDRRTEHDLGFPRNLGRRAPWMGRPAEGYAAGLAASEET